MPINTTSGAIPRPGERVGHTVNTADIYEPPQMVYEDEPPEITQVLSATGHVAVFEDGHREDLLFWVVLDDATVHGVTLNDAGLAELANVEEREGFQKYEKTTANNR